MCVFKLFLHGPLTEKLLIFLILSLFLSLPYFLNNFGILLGKLAIVASKPRKLLLTVVKFMGDDVSLLEKLVIFILNFIQSFQGFFVGFTQLFQLC